MRRKKEKKRKNVKGKWGFVVLGTPRDGFLKLLTVGSKIHRELVVKVSFRKDFRE